MKHLLVLSPALTLGLCLPTLLPAQEATGPMVTEGSRVRVTSPDLERSLVGTIVMFEGEHVVIRPAELGSSEARLTRAQIEEVSLSAGERSNWLKGGLIGAGVGAGLGLGASVLACNEVECEGGEIPAFTALSAAAGFGLGAGIGALLRTERWEPARLPDVEPVVAVLPGRPRSLAMALGLRLRI